MEGEYRWIQWQSCHDYRNGTGYRRSHRARVANYGADVVVADVNSDGVLQTLKEVEQIGRRGVAIAMDVSDKSQVEICVQKGLEAFGK